MPTRILFVDDEPDLELLIRQKYRKQIRREEVSVQFATNGREALAAIDGAEEPFDLVITDINMPVMNGIELLGELEAREHSGPVLVLSAYGDMNNIRQAMNCGAFDFLTKPIDFSDLAITQQKALGHLESTRERERLAREEQRLTARTQFLRQTLGRYLSDSVVQTLVDDPDGLQLGGEKRELTILMSDLRGFTPLCERLPPEAVVSMLNRYFGAMIDVILEQGGTIDEIIGDGILVIFGAPLSQPDHTDRALRCAIAMQQAMAEVNRANAEAGLPDLAMGIGVHTGEAVIGNIGSMRRAKYGVVGSLVNLTARIEAQTHGGQVLLSEASRLHSETRLLTRNTRSVNAKGFEEPVVIHELVGLEGQPDQRVPPSAGAPRRAPVPTPVSLPSAAPGRNDSTVEHLATLGLMMAGVAHDIRNPLSFMISFAQMSTELHEELAELIAPQLSTEVRQDADDTIADVRDNLAKIQAHGERAVQLVQSLMETVRGHRTPARPLDLNRAIARHLDLFEHSLQHAQPELSLDLRRELAPQLPQIQISDQDISRIMLNLVHNACDAARAKRREADDPGALVVVSTHQVGDQVELRVRDNGIGISPQLAQKIFDPMVTTKGQGDGLGLGLALVRGLVEEAGGTITCDSEPGQYTQFTVRLPAAS